MLFLIGVVVGIAAIWLLFRFAIHGAIGRGLGW